MSKPKFDKRKCLKCKYHGLGCGGYPVKVGFNGKSIPVFCNYSLSERTCLRKQKDGQIIDIRGNDYNNCKLYEAGKPEVEDEGEDYELNEGRDYSLIQEG